MALDAPALCDRDASFAFEDLALSTFVVRSRSGGEYHLIQPARPDDPRCQPREDADGERIEPMLRPGDLACTCKGATYRGTCWAIKAALERLSVDFADPSLGAGASVEAYRG